MDPNRRLPPPPDAAEDGSGSRVAKRWRGLLVQDVVAELLQLLPVELEEVIRRVVQEELQLYANHIPLASRLLINQDEEIKYRLHFQNKLPWELFTYSKIVAADRTKLHIAIKDSNLREVITSDPWSSVKVEIVVVEGDFGGDEKKDWTKEEFKACVVSERKDRGPLLTGQLEIKLTNGIGYLASAKFTDNSSWTRSQKFRLAVRLSPSEHIEERILEGISEPFRVKDRRVEANQKHHPPLLTDEVWRLECIMKNGVLHNRLEKGGIHNVQQFLQALTMGPERLRSLLGDEASKKGISDKRWHAIIEHAKECCQGKDLCSYNLVGQHMGDLTASPQNSVDNRKRLAFTNPKIPSPLAPTYVTSIPESSSSDPQVPCHRTRHQDEATIQVGSYCQCNAQNDQLSNALSKCQDSHSVQEYSSFQETNISSHSVQEYSSFQETNISNDLSIQMGGLPVGGIPVPSTAAIVTSIRQPSPPVLLTPEYSTTCYDEPAIYGDIQDLCQDSYDKQRIYLVQQPVSLQTIGFHTTGISDEHVFGTKSCSSGMNGNMDNEEFRTMYSGFSQALWPGEVVPTSLQKWAKLFYIVRFWISMSKHKACRRTGIVHLKCPNIEPSSSFDAPGADD